MGRRTPWHFVALLTAVCVGCGGGGGAHATPSLFVPGPVSSLAAVFPFDLATGFFDGDDHPDVVLHGWTGLDPVGNGDVGLSSLLGGPDGDFSQRAPVTVGVAPPNGFGRVLPGHFDGGSDADLVVVGGRNYGVLLGNGDGSFDPAGPILNSFPLGIVATDAEVIDADGNLRDDLAVGTTLGSIAILLSDGAGGLALSDVIPVSPGHVILDIVVADMDGDDIDDVVALDDASGITVLFGDLAGSLTVGTSIVGGLPGDAKGILVGPFDSSDGLDLAVMLGPFLTPTPHVEVMVVTGDGAGGFGFIDGTVDLPEETFGTPMSDAVRADVVFVRPGTSTLVVAAGPSGVVGRRSLYLVSMDASGVPTAEEIPVLGGVWTFRAADMDGDWLSDLVVLYPEGAFVGVSAQVLYSTFP